MYLTILNEPLHGNRDGFVSFSTHDLKIHLMEALCDEASPEEVNRIISDKCGVVNENYKSRIEITITEIELGETFSLEF